MIRSVARRMRRFAIPTALLLIVSLQPSQVAAAPRATTTVRSGSTVTTRLAQPAAVPANPAPGRGAAQPKCDKAALAKDSATAVQPGRAAQVSHDGAKVSLGAKAVQADETI